MPQPPPMAEFTPEPDDSLAPEHAAVSRGLQEAARSLGPENYWAEIDLKSVESGRLLLDASPEQSRRLLRAAIVQARHWDEQIEQVRASAADELKRSSAYQLPGSVPFWTARRHTVSAIGALIRRPLPLEKEDVLALLQWSLGLRQVPIFAIFTPPVRAVTQTLQRYAATHPLDYETRAAMRHFAQWLRASRAKEHSRLGTLVEQLCLKGTPDTQSVPPPTSIKPRPRPSPAGGPLVLRQLKSFLGTAADPEPATAPVGPDRFAMPAESPLALEHERLTALLHQIVGSRNYYEPDLRAYPEGRAILGLDPLSLGRVLLAAAERHVAALMIASHDLEHHTFWQSRWAAGPVARSLASEHAQFDRDGLFDFLLYLAMRPAKETVSEDRAQALLHDVAKATGGGANLTEGERFILDRWRASQIAGPPLGVTNIGIAQLTDWIGDGAQFYLVPGECWSDAVNQDLAGLTSANRSLWIELLKHLLAAAAARPSERWRKTALRQMEAIGRPAVLEALKRWLPLVARTRTLPTIPQFVGDTRSSGNSIHDENATVLRGLLWLVPQLSSSGGPSPELPRLVGAAAVSAYQKNPGVGPRAVKVGNAAVYALSQLESPEALGQLAMLKSRVRFGGAQKEIEKAFDALAATLQLPRDQIEEMGVPSCGLESVGRREEVLRGYRAELVVSGSRATLNWFDSRGKLMKGAPALVKKNDAEAFKELQQTVRDVDAMLSAQRDRIDSLFLERKAWPAPLWRERYLDHPLLGTLARRLIWCIGATPVLAAEGRLFDVEGRPVEVPDDAEITLWHPAGRGVPEIVAWRQRVEEFGIVQPFKQAHREVYLLTEAERRTATYSNRFAAHILRQHQFNALCAARRWKNRLRLMVDASYPPACRDLPAWGLRAEFWIEGIGTEYGADTNDSGVFLRLASDQVRFYRLKAAANSAHAGGGGYTVNAEGPGPENVNEPLPLDQIPPLVFSEILRDVDLFVGVASIGNDPTWQDGGPAGRYQIYWQSYSFGELSATAVTRREILERLVPRLKIADRCTLGDRFLVVRGNRRTYKIHLGSGNILMEPNDQYLCIVPDFRAPSNPAPVYLPFEGDSTLSIILSKAFLLADDSKITDTTINRQIDQR